jgi:hypothetical protein
MNKCLDNRAPGVEFNTSTATTDESQPVLSHLEATVILERTDWYVSDDAPTAGVPVDSAFVIPMNYEVDEGKFRAALLLRLIEDEGFRSYLFRHRVFKDAYTEKEYRSILMDLNSHLLLLIQISYDLQS